MRLIKNLDMDRPRSAVELIRAVRVLARESGTFNLEALRAKQKQYAAGRRLAKKRIFLATNASEGDDRSHDDAGLYRAPILRFRSAMGTGT